MKEDIHLHLISRLKTLVYNFNNFKLHASNMQVPSELLKACGMGCLWDCSNCLKGRWYRSPFTLRYGMPLKAELDIAKKTQNLFTTLRRRARKLAYLAGMKNES